MGTSANIIFANNYYTKDMDENIDKNISQDFDYVKMGNQTYIFLDGYPSNILPLLCDFLSSNGAKQRSKDYQYLSAWFVAYYCIFYQLKFIKASDKLSEGYIDIESYDEYRDNYTPSYEDFKSVSDFNGIGIHNGDFDEQVYTYLITEGALKDTFNIWIYDYSNKFITFIVSTEDLSQYESEEWYNYY